MRRARSTAAVLGAGLLGLMIAGCSTTPFGAPVKPAMTPAEAGAGYLSAARVAALAAAVPPPSADGSTEQAADRAASDRYRVLEGGDRWLLATAHAELRPELARQHFDCALGVRFQGQATPRLTLLLQRVMHDANEAAEQAKARAFRPRPVGVDPDRPACQRVTAASRASASYPSGSASVGAAYGEVMAAVDPAHAQQAREIGRQIGVSRAVCGMHYDADVKAGTDLGRATAREIAATPAFQDDLKAARAELAGVRRTGLTNAGCTAEAATLALPLP